MTDFCLVDLGRRVYNTPDNESDKIVEFGNASVDITKYISILYEYDAEKNATVYVREDDAEEDVLAFPSLTMFQANKFERLLRWIIDGRITHSEYEKEMEAAERESE